MPVLWDDATAEAPPAEPAAPPDATAAVDKIAGSIAGIESGGKPAPYTTLGPATKAGDRAHGKYQVMGANIPSWTEEALGKRLTPQEFLANPDAQEQTVKHHLTKYYNKYPDVRDVAAMWHSGVPYAQASEEGRVDALGTKTTDYADRVAGESAAAPATAGGAGITWDEPTPAEAPAPMTPAEQPPPMTPAPTEEITAPSVVQDTRQMSEDDFARQTNRGLGLPEEHFIGRFTAGGKAVNDALMNFGDAVKESFTTPTANESKWDVLKNELSHFAKTVSPLGVPGRILGEELFQTTLKATGSPTAAALAGMVGELSGGALLGGVGAGAMGIAKAAPEATALDAAVANAVRWAKASEASSAEAAGARQTAQEALTAAQPSTEAGARAEAALYPAGVEPEQGAAAATAQLVEKKATEKGLAGAIYDQHLAAHGTDPVITTSRENAVALADNLNAIKAQIGASWSGKPSEVLEGLMHSLQEGETVTVNDLDNMKMQLDGLVGGQPITTKVRGLWNDANALIKTEMRSTATPEELDWLNEADRQWATRLAGRQMSPRALGNLAKLAKRDPETFTQRAFGNGTSTEAGLTAKAVMDELKNDPAGSGEALRQSVFKQLFKPAEDGTVDPADALDRYATWDKNFRDAFATPQHQAFFDAERQIQQDAIKATGVAEAKTEAATGVQKEAEKATGAALAAKAEAEKPGTLARWTAHGIMLHAGVGRILGGPYAGIIIPADRLAEFFSNSARTGIIAKMLRTPSTAPVALNLVRALKRETEGTGYFNRSEEGTP